jgi:hypothetical protein
MSPELQQQLTQYLALLLDAVRTGVAFTQEQVPLIIQEKIFLARLQHTTWLVVGVVMTFLLVHFVKTAFLRGFEADAEWTRYTRAYEEANVNVRKTLTHTAGAKWAQTWMNILPGLVCLMGPFMIMTHLTMCYQVWFAPRLYILEWLIQVVK